MSEGDITNGNGNHQRTMILRLEFGRYWRAWSWLRRQFSGVSLGAICTVIAVCGGYIAHLRESVAQVRERVIVLETRVVPVIRDEAAVTALQGQVALHEARIQSLEDDYHWAVQKAGEPPTPRRRGK